MIFPLFRALALFATILVFVSSGQAQENDSCSIHLRGELETANQMSVGRYSSEPFTSLPWLRADLSFEVKRIFTNYSGDISGRYAELMSVLARKNNDLNFHPQFLALLKDIPGLQRPAGYFGDPNIDWDGAIDYKAQYTEAKYLPTLWGNSRIMCGLVEAYKTTGDKKLLESAEKLAGFYEMITKRLTDPKRVEEFTGISADEIERHLPGADGKIASTLPVIDATYAGGYVTCYFPIVEGLVKLYVVTKNEQYLNLAKKIGDFHQLFDVTTTTHAHGMLCCHYAYLMIYELTGEKKYLDRVEKRWNDMVEGGYVNAMGGTPEGVQLAFPRDEGCANSDWLRVNLKLYDLTRKTRYLELADRLMHNQFVINEWSNGGFGHRNIYCDKHGMYGFQKHFLECVWCCNFHGTLGFEYFKDHLTDINGDLVTINFAVDFEAACGAGAGKVTIVSKLIPGDYSFDIKKSTVTNNIVMSQSVAVTGANPMKLSIRVPDWATSVTLTDAKNKSLAATPKNGYIVSNAKIAPGQTFRIDYHGGLFTENRRLKKMTLKEIRASNLPEVAFRYGPWTLVARGLSRMPHLVPSKGAIENPGNLTTQWNAVVPYMAGISKINLEKLGYGSEKETAVFIFNVSEKAPDVAYAYRLLEPGDALALTVDSDKDDANGADLLITDKGASLYQSWIIEEAGDGYVRITNLKTGKLISESGNGPAVNGRKVHQWDDVHGSPAQLWKKETGKNGLVRFVNKKSGRALTRTTDGKPSKTMVWSDNDSANQLWQIEKIQ